MTYKICQIIFSCNRLEYLIPTLEAQKNLNFEGCEVDKIFIDDYPRTRNNSLITELVKLYGYEEIILHDENLGLSQTWSQFWDLIKDRNYDYVWHQEDDVVILEPVLITDLIEILNNDPGISQTTLLRGAWYSTESEPVAEPDDIIYKNFRYTKNSCIFSPMASLYRHELVKIPYRQYHNYSLNEGMIGSILYNHYNLISANVKNSQGNAYIKHIGEWFTGKRILPGEPSYENFSKFDPNKKYNSRNGAEYPL